ncbi:MAG: hypothetical protein V3R97_00610 [Gemmatimonadales bacterium]
MAYINCPQCGQSALSVATRCPRCGFGFTQHRLRHGHHPRPARNKIPLWVGGGLVVLAVVFLLSEGGGGNGAVTVPPIAGGLDEQPAEVVVQIDTGGEGVVDDVMAQPPPDAAATPAMADSAGRLDTVPPIRAAAPGESRPRPDPVVVTIVPPSAEADAAEFPEEPRWAKTWVNVRAGRSGSSEPVRILNPGELVGVDSLGLGWYRVLIDGVPVGFVDRSFLAPAPPDSLPS